MLLYEDRAYYQDVIQIFRDELNEKSTNNVQVVLNKYINALKVFGLKISKENNKYKMDNSLYSINFTSEDIHSIGILASSCENFPEDTTCKNITTFLKNLKLRMNNKDKYQLDVIHNNNDFSFYYKDLKQQIEKAEQLCKGEFLVDLIYIKNQQSFKCRGRAKEVIYNSKNVHLEVYDITKNEKLDIPLTNILSIKECPSKLKTMEITTTVVYKLKNRLAKTYKIKENEHSEGFNDKGEQTIICKNEPFDVLLSRLMRYSYNCEIISPKFLRDKMKELIEQTLERYNL